MKVLLLIFYLAGIYVCYKYERRQLKKLVNEWTVGDRRMAIFKSIFSWISIILIFITDEIILSKANNKPAKW